MSFSIFGVEIFVYGIMIALAILSAFICGLLIFKKLKYDENIAYLILAICLPLGIILARLYFVAFHGSVQSFADVFDIRSGGMAIYGGIIGGALGLFIVARIKKVGFYTLADVVVICVILAQAIGRWGNFFNILGDRPEGIGVQVSNHVPPFTSLVDGVPHFSFWFFESILNFIGFGVMLWLFFWLRSKGKYRWGIISGVYLVWYGLTRAVLEAFRTDTLLIFGSNQIVFNRVSFVLSIALVILGMLLLWAVKRGYVSQENNACIKNQQPNLETETQTPTDT